jgi:hypothetical protein
MAYLFFTIFPRRREPVVKHAVYFPIYGKEQMFTIAKINRGGKKYIYKPKAYRPISKCRFCTTTIRFYVKLDNRKATGAHFRFSSTHGPI